MDNPRKLTFITDGVNDGLNLYGLRHTVSPDGIFIRPNSENVEDNILQSIESQVKKYGTLQEVVIFGHGSPDGIDANSDNFTVSTIKRLIGQERPDVPNSAFDVDGILIGLHDIQERLGVRATNRVVFLGCDTLAEESPSNVSGLRDKAKDLGTEIVGTTSLLEGGIFQTARFVQFTPEGQVIRDHLDAGPYNPMGLAVELITKIADPDAGKWADCHVGYTQKEGAACQMQENPGLIAQALTDPSEWGKASKNQSLQKLYEAANRYADVRSNTANTFQRNLANSYSTLSSFTPELPIAAFVAPSQKEQEAVHDIWKASRAAMQDPDARKYLIDNNIILPNFPDLDHAQQTQTLAAPHSSSSSKSYTARSNNYAAMKVANAGRHQTNLPTQSHSPQTTERDGTPVMSKTTDFKTNQQTQLPRQRQSAAP